MTKTLYNMCLEIIGQYDRLFMHLDDLDLSIDVEVVG